MDLSKQNKAFAFILGLLLIIAIPAIYPKARLQYFIPYLIIVIYQKNFAGALWSSFICGFIIDILSSSAFIGLNTLGYCLATAMLYNQRVHFFADSISTLPIMTYLYAIAVTLISAILEYIFQNQPHVTAQWFVTDILFMPTFDVLYAFVVFLLPALIFGKPRKRGSDYFLR